MNTIRYLIAGALLSVAVGLNAQTPIAQGGAPEPARVAAMAPAAPVVVMICGACGEQIHTAAPVYVAQPVYPRQGESRGQNRYPALAPGQSFYGLPPVGYLPPMPAQCSPYGCEYPAPGYYPEYRVPVAPRSVWGPGALAPAAVRGAYPYPVYPQGYYPGCR